MRLSGSFGAACAALLGAGAGARPAQGGRPTSAGKPERPQVAVIKMTFSGGVAEAARELFAQRLVEGLAVAEFQVAAGPPVAARLATSGIDPRSCADEGCFRRAGPALGVAYLVTGAVG